MNIRTNFATSFAPYTPPPDDPSHAASTSSKPTSRPWFPRAPSQQPMSYQSGAVPTFNTSQAGGLGAIEEVEAGGGSAMWETRFGLRTDILAAFAYLLGPISALLLLILETHNDYVRFHAYQAALLTSPLILLRILATLIHFWPFIGALLTLLLILPSLYMAWQAYIDAARNGLVRFQIPWIGPIADRWVSEE